MKTVFAPSLRCLAPLLVLAALNACSTPRPPMRETMARHETSGVAYRPEQRFALTRFEAQWQINGQTLDVAYIGPDTQTPKPVILYLPGLGEAALSAPALRQAWAEAGYAVLSFQTASEGPSLLGSDAIRNGDFRYVGRMHFSGEASQRREALARAMLSEIKRRSDAGDSALANLELEHTAIAGFELGAQTAMSIAGEGKHTAPPPPGGIQIRAILAISPFADFSGEGFAQRYAGIAMPVMFVTGSDDDDPWGIVSSAALRRVPFEHMPAGRKWLLSLTDTTHRMLGEEAPQSALPANTNTAEAPQQKSPEQGNRGRRGGSREGAPGRSSMRSGEGPDSAAVQQPERLRARMGMVTLAFLDATVRNNGEAMRWLTHDATRWLGDGGDLLAKP